MSKLEEQQRFVEMFDRRLNDLDIEKVMLDACCDAGLSQDVVRGWCQKDARFRRSLRNVRIRGAVQ